MSDELYNGKEDSNDSKSENRPLFKNDSVGIAVWANEDKNGNYYLSAQLEFLDVSHPVWVPDEYKSAFNQFVEHIREKENGGGA